MEHDEENPNCECEACTPDDIVTRLRRMARDIEGTGACQAMREAAQTIWNLRHGYGG